MKAELERDLIVKLTPFINPEETEKVKMQITMALAKYDVTIAETQLTVYEGDKNDMIIKKFLAAKVAAGLSRRTLKYYGETIRNVLQRINKNYDDITTDDLRLYIAIRIERDGVSKTTADNERRNMSAFYGWLQKEEILPHNPMTKLDIIKPTKKKKKAFDMIDLEKIRIGCKTNREKAMIEFLASTWCRVSEVVNVKIEDIEDDKVVVHGKGDKYRTVYLNARAKLIVQTYLAERKDSNPYLFPRAKYAGDFSKMAKGRKQSELKEWYKVPELVDENLPCDMSAIEIIVRKIGKKVGVSKTHPHRFRRTGATMALRQGMPLITVSKLLGHESIETTQIYLDISDEELEQAHKKYVV